MQKLSKVNISDVREIVQAWGTLTRIAGRRRADARAIGRWEDDGGYNPAPTVEQVGA